MAEQSRTKSGSPVKKRKKIPSGVAIKILVNEEITDQIVRAIKIGCYLSQACATAGLSIQTCNKYLFLGRTELRRRAKVQAEIEQEAIDDLNRTRTLRVEARAKRKVREREDILLRRMNEPYVVFTNEIDKAMAEAEQNMLGVITRAAVGGAVIGRTIRQSPDGSSTIIEKKAEPQWQAAAWRLERKHATRWGRKVDVKGALGVASIDAQNATGTLKDQVLKIFGVTEEKDEDDFENEDLEDTFDNDD